MLSQDASKLRTLTLSEQDALIDTLLRFDGRDDTSDMYEALTRALAKLVVHDELSAPRETLDTVLSDARAHLRDAILATHNAPRHWRE